MITHGDALRPLLEQRIGAITSESTTYALIDGGKPVCFASFANWRRGEIELMGAADPGGISRGLIRELGWYAFGALACNRVTARVVASNTACLRMLERVGFVREGVLRRAEDGHDVVVMGLLKEDYQRGKFAETTKAD